MPEKQSGIKFDLTLNLGQLIVVLGMVGTLISVWVGFNNKIYASEMRISQIEKILIEQVMINKSINDVVNELRIFTAVNKNRLDQIDKGTK